jgi:hypothetical protein
MDTFGLELWGAWTEFHGIMFALALYIPHWVGVATSPLSDAKRCRLNSSNGT